MAQNIVRKIFSIAFICTTVVRSLATTGTRAQASSRPTSLFLSCMSSRCNRSIRACRFLTGTLRWSPLSSLRQHSEHPVRPLTHPITICPPFNNIPSTHTPSFTLEHLPPLSLSLRRHQACSALIGSATPSATTPTTPPPRVVSPTFLSCKMQ